MWELVYVLEHGVWGSTEDQVRTLDGWSLPSYGAWQLRLCAWKARFPYLYIGLM